MSDNPPGRPTDYRPEYAEHARKLCLLGATDKDLADWFEVVESTVNLWKLAHPEFSAATQPTPADIEARDAARRAHREPINARKRANRAKNPSERIRNAMGARMWAAIRGRTDGRLFTRLGYSVEDLLFHLERGFCDGMSWENYGMWHIDHIRPCASFDLTDAAQFAECWSLANLQPLWAAENVRKGARLASA